jgi:cytochrome c556
MKHQILLGLAVAAIGWSGLAVAQGTGVALQPDAIIAARQAGFDLQNGVAVAMKAAVDGGQDVKPLADGAKGIAAWAKVIPSMFPAGTEKGHDTKAKPDIWSNRAEFEKDAANLATEAQKLQTLAEANDKAGFAAQFKATGAACGACHRAFRER